MLNERFVKEIKSGQFFFRETHINPGNCVFVLKKLCHDFDNFKHGKFSKKKEKYTYFKILLFFQLRQEKAQLEHTLEQEQECLVNKLMRRIGKTLCL